MKALKGKFKWSKGLKPRVIRDVDCVHEGIAKCDMHHSVAPHHPGAAPAPAVSRRPAVQRRPVLAVPRATRSDNPASGSGRTDTPDAGPRITTEETGPRQRPDLPKGMRVSQSFPPCAPQPERALLFRCIDVKAVMRTGTTRHIWCCVSCCDTFVHSRLFSPVMRAVMHLNGIR